MPQPIVHFEIAAKDNAKLRGFYGALFGWSITLLSELGLASQIYGDRH